MLDMNSSSTRISSAFLATNILLLLVGSLGSRHAEEVSDLAEQNKYTRSDLTELNKAAEGHDVATLGRRHRRPDAAAGTTRCSI
jgi:hypothetical protein